MGLSFYRAYSATIGFTGFRAGVLFAEDFAVILVAPKP